MLTIMQFIEDLIKDVHFLKVAVWCLIAFDALAICGCVAAFFWVRSFNRELTEDES